MFSVLISTYHRDNPSHLNDALNSIISQSFLPAQIVLIEDGPIDENLKDVINSNKSFAESLGINFEIVVTEKNLGLGLALKKGSSYCNQPFIVRMDSDDVSASDRLEILKNFINLNPDLDIIGSHIEEFREEIGDLNRFRLVPLDQNKIISFSKLRNPMNHVSICMKTEKLLQNNYEDILWHEDYFLWLKHIFNGSKFENINKSLVHVRVSDLTARRAGLAYIKAEISFLQQCYERGYFNFFQVSRYFLSRVLIRFLPKNIIEKLYKLMRHSHYLNND